MDFLTKDPIRPGIIAEFCGDPAYGALVSFLGIVRNRNQGREVSWLEYEAMESLAEKKIAEILATAKQKYQLNLAYCQHRLSKVLPGEPAVVVVTASGHRTAAYQANMFIIDAVKAEVPVWKKEIFTDGTYIWDKSTPENLSY